MTIALSGTIVNDNYNYQTPATGATVTLNNTDWNVVINPAASIAALTIVMMANPIDGTRVDIYFVKNIQALTVNGNSGQSVVNVPTVAAAGSKVTAIYRNATTTWYFSTVYDYVAGTVVLTDGATPALDASLGNTFLLTAAGNRTIAVPTNPIDGKKIVILHKASGADRTLALNAGAGGFRFGTTVIGLTLTTNTKTDYIGCIYNASANFWDVVAYSKGY